MGAMVDSTGTTDTQVQWRLTRARQAWFRLQTFFSWRRIPVYVRIRRFYDTVAQTALWGSGCWVPSCSLQRVLSAQENRWLRRIVEPAGRGAQEDWVRWFRRTKRRATAAREETGESSLWERALRSVFTWHGHAARRLHLPFDPSASVLGWRDICWWRQQRDLVRAGLPAQRHALHNWPRTVDEWISDYIGDEWKMAAQDRTSWKSCIAGWIDCPSRKWGV